MKKFAYIKVIIFLTAVVLTVCFGIGKINIHNIKDNSEVKSLSEYFWKDTGKKMNYIVKEYNQTAEIDNYTITLDSAVFNDKTETIYARFRVSEKNSRVKSYIYLDDNMWKAFGENNRFSLWVNADVGREGKFYGKYDGDDLIIYCKFQYYCDEIEDTYEIYLADKSSGKTTYENCAAKFLLEPTSDVVEIKCSSTRIIWISPVAIKVSSKTDLFPRTIEICYKNGETQEILNINNNVAKEEALSLSWSDSMTFIEIVQTPELIELEQIKSIKYNGIEYMR